MFHFSSLWFCSFSILFFLSSSSVHSDPSGPVCAGGSHSWLSLRGQRLPSAGHSMDSRRWDDIMPPCLFDLLERSPHYSTVCLSQVWSAFLFSKKLTNWHSTSIFVHICQESTHKWHFISLILLSASTIFKKYPFKIWSTLQVYIQYNKLIMKFWLDAF